MQLTSRDLELLKGEACKRDFKRFIKEFWHLVEPSSFVDGWHLDALVDHLTHIREIRNLLVLQPPRTSKSLMLSVLFPSWYWCSKPETRFITTSYSIQLAERDSVKSRHLIESDLYKAYYGHIFSMTSDENTKRRYSNSRGGYRLATSLEGSNTGEGAEILICDDPHNIADAESKAERDSVIRFISTVWSSRLNDPKTGCRIIALQRCHTHDLAEYILKSDTDNNWTKLILPLEAGKCKHVSTRLKDPRQPGELLCPERIPAKEANFLKNQLGKRAFEAQYNQQPMASDQQLFNTDCIEYYDHLPENGMRIVAADLSITGQGDFTVILVADLFPDGSIYLVHMHREKMQAMKVLPTLKAINEQFKPLIIFVEQFGFQEIVIQEARQQRLPVKGSKIPGDKITKSVMAQVKVDSGLFFLPKANYTKAFIEELQEFPNGINDDVVDALSILCVEGTHLYRCIPQVQKQETPEETAKRRAEEFRLAQEEHQRKVKEDEENYKLAFLRCEDIR